MITLDFTDFFSFLLFTLILYFLSSISKRLGEVMGMKKYYYLYYAGMYFTFSAAIIMGFSLGSRAETFFYGYGFFATGLTFGLIATIKYWGWLIIELIKDNYLE